MNLIPLKLLTALVLATSGLNAAAQPKDGFPDKPITMVVPYPAGQSVDSLARMMGEGLTKYLGQPVIIDNKAGAGGTIGSKYLIRMPADGYTLSMNASGPLGIAPHLFKEANYDPRTDFTPIMLVAAVAQTLVVSAKSNIKSLADLIEAAKAKPNGLNFGSPGNGSTSHLTQEMFKQRAGIKMQHVPYKGGPAAVTDLLGGQIEVLFEAAPLVIPFINRGELRALAVSTAKPIDTLPSVRPIAAQGLDLWCEPGLGLALSPHQLAPKLTQSGRFSFVPNQEFIAKFIFPTFEFTPDVTVRQTQSSGGCRNGTLAINGLQQVDQRIAN